MNFLAKEGVIDYESTEGRVSKVIESDKFISIRTTNAGFMKPLVQAGDVVIKGQVMAYVTNPYTGEVIQTVTASTDGIIAFEYDSPIVYQNTAAFKLIPLS